MCIRFASRKIWVAGYQCDDTDFDFHISLVTLITLVTPCTLLRIVTHCYPCDLVTHSYPCYPF